MFKKSYIVLCSLVAFMIVGVGIVVGIALYSSSSGNLGLGMGTTTTPTQTGTTTSPTQTWTTTTSITTTTTSPTQTGTTTTTRWTHPPLGPDPFLSGLEVSMTTNETTYTLDPSEMPEHKENILTYGLGEEIHIEFSIKNTRSYQYRIEPFPPLVEIMRLTSGELVRSFPGGTGDKSLAPGEVATYTLTWDQRDNQQQQVTYGYYDFELGRFYVEGYPYTSRSIGCLVLILPPEGTMEKTILVNESQTVNGITITLERVELSALEMKVFALCTPPGYHLSQDPDLPSTWPMGVALAEYSLDNDTAKNAGSSGSWGIHLLENGEEHKWCKLDPVPNGTKELTFRITKFADWQGPWEFHVPLQ
jgi:hypothetical protein